MNQDQKDFLTKLATAAGQKADFQVKEDKKRQFVDQNEFSDEDKEELRSAMDFYAVDAKGKKTLAKDKRGQEYSLDTEAANRKGQQVPAEVLAKVQKQFEKVVKMVQKMREAKGDDGEPLFTAQDIADEIFTPLVREGILPENLVTDQYSEVQKLLGASFTAYKETLEEARQDEEKAKAKTEADFHGAGSKLDMLSGAGAKLADLGERVVDSFTPERIGTPEERKRARDLASSSISAISSAVSAYSASKDMASGKAVTDARDMLAGVEEPSDPSTFFNDFGESVCDLFAKDPNKANIVGRYVRDGIMASAKVADKTSDLVSNIQELKGVQIAEAALSTLEEAITSGKENAVSLVELKKIREEMVKANSAGTLRKGVAAVIAKIDTALSDAVASVHAPGGANIGGAYIHSVEAEPIVKLAVESEPDCEEIVDLLAEGFTDALKLAAPDKNTSFERVGKQMAAAFKAGVKPDALANAISKDAESAFDLLVEPAKSAAQKALADADSGDPTATKDLKKKLGKSATREAMKEKVAEKSNEKLSAQMEQSEEEIAEYERQLVLMDEGGEELAGQRSIEKLIAQLKQDKKVLELTVSISSGLTGLAGGGMEIAKGAKAVSEKLLGEVTGPLQAANMIVQLSVNIVKAAERWRLWYKFRANLELARKAGSALSTTIEGFYQNKQGQIAFHTIEDAMLAVQIAGSILGSVPEPITLAVGKTMSAVAQAASAANTVAGKIYDEVKLREAWSTTKAAMNNPKDRSLGVAALRLNTTLAMHAIAWAGLEKRDPIARVVLDACGLNEQTLSDGGTTEKKVRQYLETLLDEDRKLTDTQQIKTNWQPKDLALGPKDWVIVQVRAARDAKPALRKDDTGTILEAFKKIDARGSLDVIKLQVKNDATEMDVCMAEVETVVTLLNAYQPRTEDGSPHDEMAAVVAQFLKLADDQRLALARIRDEITAEAKAAKAKARSKSQPKAQAQASPPSSRTQPKSAAQASASV
jgi:hypothetical protein